MAHSHDPRETAGLCFSAERLLFEPVGRADAVEMTRVLADPALYQFVGGRPPTRAELAARYRRWEWRRSDDGREEWLNWIMRRSDDRTAVGTVQATISDRGRRADVAWVVGLAWQGRGYASEAARALVAWLDARGVGVITAHVHPDHRASQAVARNAGLVPTDAMEGGEVVWRRSLHQRSSGR